MRLKHLLDETNWTDREERASFWEDAPSVSDESWHQVFPQSAYDHTERHPVAMGLKSLTEYLPETEKTVSEFLDRSSADDGSSVHLSVRHNGGHARHAAYNTLENCLEENHPTSRRQGLQQGKAVAQTASLINNIIQLTYGNNSEEERLFCATYIERFPRRVDRGAHLDLLTADISFKVFNHYFEEPFNADIDVGVEPLQKERNQELHDIRSAPNEVVDAKIERTEKVVANRYERIIDSYEPVLEASSNVQRRRR